MPNFTGLKVMVIDDATTIARAAEIYIGGVKGQPTGIIIQTVSNGFDAIPEIFRFLPDIIFLDVMMPKVEGFPICKAIKSNAQLKHIKVVMLTSKSGLFDRAKGADAGCDDYIEKPFKKDGILEVIARHAPAKFLQAE